MIEHCTNLISYKNIKLLEYTPVLIASCAHHAFLFKSQEWVHCMFNGAELLMHILYGQRLQGVYSQVHNYILHLALICYNITLTHFNELLCNQKSKEDGVHQARK